MKLFARLLVSDFPSEFVFWRDAVGLPVRYGDETMGYAQFDLGSENAGLELFTQEAFLGALGKPGSTQQAATGSGTVVVLSVDDVDTTYARVLEQGASAFAPPTDHPEWLARTAHFTDPEGHLIEIYHVLAQPQS